MKNADQNMGHRSPIYDSKAPGKMHIILALQEKLSHKKSRLQKANGQGRDLSNLQIAKSLPISLYNQIIHVFHYQDRLQRTASYDLML